LLATGQHVGRCDEAILQVSPNSLIFGRTYSPELSAMTPRFVPRPG
jgi:hypothetical protein